MNISNIMLERRDLINTLNELKNNRLIIVCAPAGYGKTVSVVQWFDKDSRAKAVFFADEYDNDTSGFCVRFCSALLTCQPRNATLDSFVSHPSFQNAPEEFTLRAISALSARKQTVLVVDDLHLLHNSKVLQLLRVFIGRLPKNFQVVLISRHDLRLSFSDLWIKGQVAYVGADQFLFTEKDIIDLCKIRGGSITQEQAKDVSQKTQGWAIGINAFLLSGGDYSNKVYGYLDDFIRMNIWENWDESTQNFMLRTSELKELNYSLCAALTGNLNCDKFIKELLQKGAFITQLKKGVYRYHHLFQQFLKRMANERGEGFLYSLLETEGQWHLAQGDFYSAIDCFIRCKSYIGIANCFDFLAGSGNSNFALERLIPIFNHQEVKNAAKHYPRLLFLLIICAFADGRANDMVLFMDEYYSRHNEILAAYPESVYKSLFLRIYDFRVPPSRMMDEIGALSDTSDVSFTPWSASLHMPFLHRALKDYSEMAIGNVIDNCKMLQSNIGWILGEEATMLLQILTAELLYEKGDLEQAYEYAVMAAAEAKSHFLPESTFCAMSILVFVLDALNREGDKGSMAASKVCESISQLIEETKSYELLHNFDALSTRRQIAVGNIKAAKGWIDSQNSESPILYKMYADFTTCRAFIATENFDCAIILLKKVLGIARAFNRTLDIIEVQILLAVAYWKKKGKFQDIALDHLDAAVCMAYPYGYVQMFVNEGAKIAGMLHKLTNRVKQRKEGGSGLFSFVRLLYLKSRDYKNVEAESRTAKVPVVFTDKQKAVAQLLCQGKTYEEIAETLGIKRGSVRTHLKFIYNKLDVTNGIDAVDKIKIMGLLNQY
ncbi:MAG: LuxR C-terminal-related transcriptional regulator [Defluviitaleaceae bacterium]|nr:LuxR C-terminal-related transcriptional regulator [Defluviitaleaceae bacterium]